MRLHGLPAAVPELFIAALHLLISKVGNELFHKAHFALFQRQLDIEADKLFAFHRRRVQIAVRNELKAGEEALVGGERSADDGSAGLFCFLFYLFPIGVILAEMASVEIEAHGELHLAGEIDRLKGDLLEAFGILIHMEKTLKGYFNAFAGFGRPYEFAREHAGAHIQRADEAFHLRGLHIELLTVQRNAGIKPIHRIDHKMGAGYNALISRVFFLAAILINPVEIAAEEGIAGRSLFKIATDAHILIAEGKNRFGNAAVIRVEPLFNDFPRIELKILISYLCHRNLHTENTVFMIFPLGDF